MRIGRRRVKTVAMAFCDVIFVVLMASSAAWAFAIGGLGNGFTARLPPQSGQIRPRIAVRATEQLEQLKVSELKQHLKAKGLAVTGKKNELIERLKVVEGLSSEDVDDAGGSVGEVPSIEHVDDVEDSLEEHVQSYLHKFTIKQLKQHLKKHGHSTTGTREDLIERAWADYFHRHYARHLQEP